jgi:hypothetical protein
MATSAFIEYDDVRSSFVMAPFGSWHSKRVDFAKRGSRRSVPARLCELADATRRVRRRSGRAGPVGRSRGSSSLQRSESFFLARGGFGRVDSPGSIIPVDGLCRDADRAAVRARVPHRSSRQWSSIDGPRLSAVHRQTGRGDDVCRAGESRRLARTARHPVARFVAARGPRAANHGFEPRCSTMLVGP